MLWRASHRWTDVFFVVCLAFASLVGAPPASAVPVPGEQCQPEVPSGTGITFRWEETIESPALEASVCFAHGFRCAMPVHESTTYQFLDPGCDPLSGPCQYQARVQFRLPGNQLNQDDDSGAHFFNSRWYEGDTAPTCYDFNCGQKSICGQAFTGGGVIDGDRAVFTATVSNTCSGVEDEDRVWSLAVLVCQTSFSCRKTGKAEGIALGGPEVAAELGCPGPPPPARCKGDASCKSCPAGIGIGGGGAAAGGAGGGAGSGPGDPQSGPGA